MSKRTEELKIRISPEDKERIKLKMEDAGVLNMSAYVRKMALDGICIRLDLQDVRQLVSMLQRCTNNLNQYAKRANETGSIYAADIEDLQNRLDEIWELSRQSLASLAATGLRQEVQTSPVFLFPARPCLTLLRLSKGRKPRLFLRSRNNSVRETNAQPAPATGLFTGFGVRPQQAETAVSGNAGNRSFEPLWEQSHCLPSSAHPPI